MAQRISRAKATLQRADEPFMLPASDTRAERLRSVLHVLYLLFNEGYASSSGPDLARTDLSGEAIRLARAVHAALPEDVEAAGLLALMLLTDARRPARTDLEGELVPLGEQDRTRWNARLIAEGTAILDEAAASGHVGEYQLQAAIAAAHDRAASEATTDWPEIVSLYGLLERMTGNPMVTLNRAVAVAMVDGPRAGLDALEGLTDRLGDHQRLHTVRAHLLERAGDREAAIAEFRAAAARTTNLREQHYLVTQAARLSTEGPTSETAGGDHAPHTSAPPS